MKTLSRSETGRRILTVLSGSTIAQGLHVLVSPVLTRVYAPEDFGIFALYLSVAAISLVFMTGRIELSIPLPKDDQDAFQLLAIASSLAVVVTGVSLIGVVVFHSALVTMPEGATRLGGWLYVLPVSVFLMGMYQILLYWATRQKYYGELAKSRIVLSVVMCSGQLVAGYRGAGPAGLIGAHAIGQVACNVTLLWLTRRHFGQLVRGVSGPAMKAVGLQYRTFPLYLVPGQLANAASAQMPVIALTALFGSTIAGFYSLAERVLLLPSSLVIGAVGEVFRQRVIDEYHLKGNCRDLYLAAVKRLALVGLIPALAALTLAPWAFSIAFGEEWRASGEICALLGTLVFFQIVSVPLAQTPLVAKMYRLDLLWQFGRLLSSIGAIWLGYAVFGSYRAAVFLHAMGFSVLYVLHSLMQYKAACGDGASWASEIVTAPRRSN